MKSSIILNNSPKCPYCFETDYTKLSPADVESAIIDGEKHFEVILKCNTCGGRSYYFLDMDMENRKDVDKSSDRYKKPSSYYE